MNFAMKCVHWIFYGLIGGAYLTITAWALSSLLDYESMDLPLPMWYYFGHILNINKVKISIH